MSIPVHKPLVHKLVLDNGFTILFYPRPHAPIFVGCLLVKVGSVNESLGCSGVSHLLEHMMFKGTKLFGTVDYQLELPLLQEVDALAMERLREQAKLRTCYSDGAESKVRDLGEQIASLEGELKSFAIPNELWSIYQLHGGVNLNASTSCDGTKYYVTLPSNKLELWAFLESDRLQNAVFREFYAEREVVTEERRQRVDNDPDGVLYEQFNSLINAGCPYASPVVGWPCDLATMTRGQIEAYFRAYYAPSNIVAVLVGDLQWERVQELAERYFGALPARPEPSWRFVERAPQLGARSAVINIDANPQVLMGYPGPKPGHDDQYALMMAGGILAEGFSSRFYRRLVEPGWALDASAYLHCRAWSSDWCIALSPQASHSTQEVVEVAQKLVDELRERGPEPSELQRICNIVRLEQIMTLDSPQGLAVALAQAEAFKGGWQNFDDSQRFLTVTPESVQEALDKYMRPDRLTKVEIVRKTD